MNYLTKLRKGKSLICLGLDPILEKIPIKGKPEETIVKFLTSIVEAMIGEDSLPGACKMNYSMYASHGIMGLRALKKVTNFCNKNKIPTIIEHYRADPDSERYGEEIFNFYKADATTFLPYFGDMSVHGLLKFCLHGKGVYIINKVGHANDFQQITQNEIPVHLRISHKIVEWHTPGIGSLFEGKPEEIENIHRFFIHSKKEVPLLLPLGTNHPQGLISALTKDEEDIAIHRVIDPTIIYSYIRERSDDYCGAAANELKRTNKRIQEIIQNKQA